MDVHGVRIPLVARRFAATPPDDRGCDAGRAAWRPARAKPAVLNGG
jgi:hypothetical protein